MTAETEADEVCTYCLGKVPVEECTWDHVVADSWYADTAEGIEKWQVPACSNCNHELGKLEREALIRFGMCLDGENPAYKDIVVRAKRAMDPTHGKNDKDERMRQALLEKIKGELVEIGDFKAAGALPFFKDNYDAGVRHTVPISADGLHAIARKWTRGFYRLIFGGLLPADAQIDVHYLTEEGEAEVFGELLPHALALDRGPDIQVLLWRVKEDGREAFMASYRIWEEYRVHCAVTLGEEPAA
jgi:hypothetical protein